MKDTIKKILKEETGGGYHKLELKILNWMFKQLDGKPMTKEGGSLPGEIARVYQSTTDFKKLVEPMRTMFGLNNKLASEMLYLYRHNWTPDGFVQTDNVNRAESKRWRVLIHRDVSAWQTDEYEVYGTDEQEADSFAHASDTQWSDEKVKYHEKYIEGEEEMGDIGDIYDTEIELIENVIKDHLSLLKENTSMTTKYKDRFLIKVCKVIERYFRVNNKNKEDMRWHSDEYEYLLKFLEETLAIGDENDLNFMYAVYLENDDRANGDWNSLVEKGLSIPKMKTFNGEKEFGASIWVTQETVVDGWSEAELNYYNYYGYLDWDEKSQDTHETWDEEVVWREK
jgi:hypothetical protein